MFLLILSSITLGTSILFERLNKIQNLRNEVTSNPIIQKDQEKLISFINRKNAFPLNYKTSKYTAYFFLVIFPISFMVGSHLKYSSIMTFEQHIKIISPYINQYEKDLFISKFASMQTYDDYRMVMIKIDSVALKNKILLPEQIYSYNY